MGFETEVESFKVTLSNIKPLVVYEGGVYAGQVTVPFAPPANPGLVTDPQDAVTAGAKPKDARRESYVTDTAPVVLFAEPSMISVETATPKAELKLAFVTPAVALWVPDPGTFTVLFPTGPEGDQVTPLGPWGVKNETAANGIISGNGPPKEPGMGPETEVDSFKVTPLKLDRPGQVTVPLAPAVVSGPGLVTDPQDNVTMMSACAATGTRLNPAQTTIPDNLQIL